MCMALRKVPASQYRNSQSRKVDQCDYAAVEHQRIDAAADPTKIIGSLRKFGATLQQYDLSFQFDFKRDGRYAPMLLLLFPERVLLPDTG